MRKLNTRNTMLCCALLLSMYCNAQNNNQISLQKKPNISTGRLAPHYTPAFNPTLKTQANPPAAGLTDGVDVRVFPSSHVQSEVTIEQDVHNPLHLVASANTLLAALTYNQGYYYSLDGGTTWSGSDQLQNVPSDKIDGDPSVSYAANGTIYLTTIAAGLFSTGGYYFQKSTDGGQTWSTGVKFNSSNLDKDMNTADNITTSPFANNFYQTWTDFNSGNGAVAFNKSTDGGTTFSTKLIVRSGTVGFGQGTNVQTGPNGEVYVCYADHTTVVSPYKATGMGFARSMDGGVTFSPATVIFPYSGTRVDGSDATYNFTRVNDFPSMAVDKSGRGHNGRIYITYPELVSGKSVIKVRFSDNQGTTWSNGVVVSIPNAREAFFPWITVDQKYGIAWVAYYAFDQATGYSTNTYVAASINGTTWFTQKASDVSHITQPIDNNNFAFGYAGDYIGIAAYNGIAHTIWMDQRNGTWQVYTSSVTAHTAPLLTEEAAPVSKTSILSVNPNPFSGTIHVSLSSTTIKSVQLFYQSGALARQWNSGNMETLNVGTLPKGIYTISVTDKDGKSYSQKILKE